MDHKTMQKNLEVKKKQMEELNDKMKTLQREIEQDKKQMVIGEAEQREQAEADFFRSTFDFEVTGENKTAINVVINGSYVVFNQKTEIIKIVDAQKEFDKFIEFENWLITNKLYAHSLSSFQDRSIGWYNLPFIDQLRNLTWTFNADGMVNDTSW